MSKAGTTAPPSASSTSPSKPGSEGIVQVETLKIKCLNGHDSDVIGLVISPECRQGTRLVCISCITGQYADYVKFIVPFSNIKNGSFKNLENVPVDKSVWEINEVVKTIKQPIGTTADPIDEFFVSVKKRIGEAIDRFQRDYKDYVKRTMDRTNTAMQELRKLWSNVMSINDILITMKQFMTLKDPQDKTERKRINDEINTKVVGFLKDLVASKDRLELEKFFDANRMDLRFFEFKQKNDEAIRGSLEKMLDDVEKLNLLMLSSFLPQKSIEMKFDVPELYRRNVEPTKFQKNVFRVQQKGAVVSWPFEKKIHYIISFQLTGKVDKPFYIKIIDENEYQKWPQDSGIGINIRELKANKDMRVEGGEKSGIFNDNIVENYYQVEFAHTKGLFSIRDMTSDVNFIMNHDPKSSNLQNDSKRLILACLSNLTIQVFDVSIVTT